MASTFTITCYGKTKRYPESKREAMKKEYMMGMAMCDGSEKDRYTNIYMDLVNGKKEYMDTERPLVPKLKILLADMFASV